MTRYTNDGSLELNTAYKVIYGEDLHNFKVYSGHN